MNIRPNARRSTVLTLLVLASLACSSCQSTAVQRRRGDARQHGTTAIQALIGAAEFRNLDHQREDPSDPGSTVSADLTTMPVIGFAGQYALGGKRVEFGLDGGLLYSWKSDSQYVSTGTGTGVLLIDRSMKVADLFFGGYASAILGDSFRLYGGVGPSMMWGDADYRDETGGDSGSAFGVGYYVRGGAEFRLADRSFLGFGARWVDTRLDFGGQIGTVDAEGIQGFLTFTQGF